MAVQATADAADAPTFLSAPFAGLMASMSEECPLADGCSEGFASYPEGAERRSLPAELDPDTSRLDGTPESVLPLLSIAVPLILVCEAPSSTAAPELACTGGDPHPATEPIPSPTTGSPRGETGPVAAAPAAPVPVAWPGPFPQEAVGDPPVSACPEPDSGLTESALGAGTAPEPTEAWDTAGSRPAPVPTPADGSSPITPAIFAAEPTAAPAPDASEEFHPRQVSAGAEHLPAPARADNDLVLQMRPAAEPALAVRQVSATRPLLRRPVSLVPDQPAARITGPAEAPAARPAADVPAESAPVVVQQESAPIQAAVSPSGTPVPPQTVLQTVGPSPHRSAPEQEEPSPIGSGTPESRTAEPLPGARTAVPTRKTEQLNRVESALEAPAKDAAPKAALPPPAPAAAATAGGVTSESIGAEVVSGPLPPAPTEESPASLAPRATDLRWVFEAPGKDQVGLRVRSVGGQVQVTVQGVDRTLRPSLSRELPSLVQSLQREGWEVAASLSSSARGLPAASQPSPEPGTAGVPSLTENPSFADPQGGGRHQQHDRHGSQNGEAGEPSAAGANRAAHGAVFADALTLASQAHYAMPGRSHR